MHHKAAILSFTLLIMTSGLIVAGLVCTCDMPLIHFNQFCFCNRVNKISPMCFFCRTWGESQVAATTSCSHASETEPLHANNHGGRNKTSQSAPIGCLCPAVGGTQRVCFLLKIHSKLKPCGSWEEPSCWKLVSSSLGETHVHLFYLFFHVVDLFFFLFFLKTFCLHCKLNFLVFFFPFLEITTELTYRHSSQRRSCFAQTEGTRSLSRPFALLIVFLVTQAWLVGLDAQCCRRVPVAPPCCFSSAVSPEWHHSSPNNSTYHD